MTTKELKAIKAGDTVTFTSGRTDAPVIETGEVTVNRKGEITVKAGVGSKSWLYFFSAKTGAMLGQTAPFGGEITGITPKAPLIAVEA